MPAARDFDMMMNPVGRPAAKTENEKICILLVEDNEADVYLLEKVFKQRNLNYELILYENGEQCISALQNDRCVIPDLIIVDLNLPRRDGFEVLQMIRAKPAMVGVPVAVLTSSDAPKDRHRIALTGGERYIHKPPMLEEFLEQVGQAIGDMLESR